MQKFIKKLTSGAQRDPGRWGGTGYSGFQVTGMIEGFFWVRKFGKYFFGYLDLSRDFLGVLKRIGSALAA